MSEFKTLRELEAEATKLHGQIMTENHAPTKLKLMNERSMLSFRIGMLTRKKIAEAEKDYKKRLETLIKENLTAIIFEVNGYKIPVNPKNLEAKYKFRPCGHTNTIKLYNVLKGVTDDRSEQWRLLYQRWQITMRDSDYIEGQFKCQKCRRENPSTLRGKEKSVGIANWKLKFFR